MRVELTDLSTIRSFGLINRLANRLVELPIVDRAFEAQACLIIT